MDEQGSSWFLCCHFFKRILALLCFTLSWFLSISCPVLLSVLLASIFAVVANHISIKNLWFSVWHWPHCLLSFSPYANNTSMLVQINMTANSFLGGQNPLSKFTSPFLRFPHFDKSLTPLFCDDSQTWNDISSMNWASCDFCIHAFIH